MLFAEPGEALIKPFDDLRANGRLCIPFVVMMSLAEASNHEWNQLNQNFPGLFLLSYHPR